ncbi:putative enzyme related to lactoylglutathione lyase [Crossiella equi]|uniref:Enzyme related to lactoylglutathione lyase n=1 Tax=Crossiella equi TaxID=130796 RepID=A0ABS5AQ31_9PSEU|nr:VOC family protein [Crossiella equi]MBP2478680.1 putative enzyme related to lactoylglutathione lyase [Crossiella equi]
MSSPDLTKTRSFYMGLFDWSARVAPADQGGYTVFTKGGKAVAGAGPLLCEEQPTAWRTFVIVDDAEATSARVEPAGGQVVVPVGELEGTARMGVFTDRAGAQVGVWEPGEVPGCELFNESGTLCWNELTTADSAGSKAFYGEVFGWEARDRPLGDMAYTQWRLERRTVAGMRPAANGLPHWMAYFAVRDCDTSAAIAEQLGGQVRVAPMDTVLGRAAVLADPHGAEFTIITM